MGAERERTDKRNGKQQAFEHGLPPDAPEVSLSRLDGSAAGFCSCGHCQNAAEIRISSPAASHTGIWIEPKLLARAKSAEGKVRHPFFKGLPEDL